jgi:deoxyribodipyrimidine photo-lyase
MEFSTDYRHILEQINKIDPVKYGKTRNYIGGAVTQLSPYVSRGVISTKQIADALFSKGYKPYQMDSFLKELAWRDYFQQVWIARGDEIDSDLKQKQPDFDNSLISSSILNATTGIEAIDTGVSTLQNTGYMHNHTRMYVSSIACNIAKSHWKLPAQWMYYYLLDADWASNALSWQWVAGSFSNKKYIANQENINKYSNSNQKSTFLDMPYEHIPMMRIPESLIDKISLKLTTNLPNPTAVVMKPDLPIYIYNFYNLDPKWDEDIKANRILLLEPHFYKKYPVSDRTLDFVLALSKNISNVQVFIGSFEELKFMAKNSEIHYKEHPTNIHYKGIVHHRDWMFPSITGYYNSFFSFWKKCEKSLPLCFNF